MTIQQIKALLKELQIQPKKSLGQNFLTFDGVIASIIEKVGQFKPRSVIEVGPGLGSLTTGLLLQNFDLYLIEFDRALASYWKSKMTSERMIEADALQLDWQNLLGLPGPRVLVSNLPYQISSSIVIERCLDAAPVDAMVLMFQAEVAQKIRRSEKSSLLSVLVQGIWSVERLTRVSPGCFYPPPQVSSEVLVFTKLKSSEILRPPFF